MIKIAFIVGHSAKSKGAVANGISEFNFWDDYFDDHGVYLGKIADGLGIEIAVFNREKQKAGGYSAEMRKVHGYVDSFGADISIECHFNSSASMATGHEILHLKGSNGGRVIAKILDEIMDDQLSNRDRGIKAVSIYDRGGIGLSVGKSKSVLIEPFFSREIKDNIDQLYNRMNHIFTTFFEEIGEKKNIVLTEAEYKAILKLLA